MKRAVVRLLEAVYNFANPFVDESWLSWPWFAVAFIAGTICDWLDPIASVADRGQPS